VRVEGFFTRLPHGFFPADKVSPVSGVVPRADGRYLIAGSFDSFVYVIDRRMMQVLHSLAGHEERVSRVVLHEDTVLAPSFDGNVVKWEFE